MIEYYSNSEMKAQSMFLQLRGYYTNRPGNEDNYNDPHYCGNKIIELAEQIKAERAVIAMNS